jgi:GxxExxY protein
MDPYILTRQVIGCAIEVHRNLGPGLLESAYEACLVHELRFLDVRFQTQVKIDSNYKGELLCNFYRADLIVEDYLLVELKAVENLSAIHSSQMLTYLKLSNLKLGLLINFNVPILKDGIKRFVTK